MITLYIVNLIIIFQVKQGLSLRLKVLTPARTPASINNSVFCKTSDHVQKSLAIRG